jgi:hypothetical protein
MCARASPLTVTRSSFPAMPETSMLPLTEEMRSDRGFPPPRTVTSPLTERTSELSPSRSATTSPLTLFRRCVPSTPREETSALTADTSTVLFFGTWMSRLASPSFT